MKTVINVCRLEWLGDAVRKVDDRLVEGKPRGRKNDNVDLD